MNLDWILLAVAGVVLALAFTLLLLRMSSYQDRVARHEEEQLSGYPDAAITQRDN